VSGESHTYNGFEEETRKIASAFYKKGLRHKDVVIYMSYDMIHLHIFFTGVWRANGCIRSLYPEEDEGIVIIIELKQI
jgi:acyl-CoA synthetase (AMP-forming)/AMP-acid ligase II